MESKNLFSIASLVCGILSLATCCMIFLSIPLGALGILFALLGRKADLEFDTVSRLGLMLSFAGILFGVFAIITVILQIPTLLNDPEYIRRLDTLYEQMYGQSFFEYWQNYGIPQ